jgi:alkaline phosphatase D
MMHSHIFAYGLVLTLCGLLTGAEVCEGAQMGGVEVERLETNSHIFPFHQGVATFEVTDTSATVWARIEGHDRVEVHLFEEKRHAETQLQGTYLMLIRHEQDHIGKFQISGLTPLTTYSYHIRPEPTFAFSKEKSQQSLTKGRFRTAPAPEDSHPITFIWSGDLGGQGHCRQPRKGYELFERMRVTQPDFGLFVGDTIYADGKCASPPNFSGYDFIAETLPQYRDKHRYQREDQYLQRFLAETPLYAIWDDHEVRNDFSGPFDDQMPMGRQAFQEYWLGLPFSDDPHRLYRSVKQGTDLEIFILDTRQYRSPNTQQDGKDKTMLGKTQREWLLRGLQASSATWKVIVSSVPLSILKGSWFRPAIDSWAKGGRGTGFHFERNQIVTTILSKPIRNVVWLTSDVHFPQVLAYDPNDDGKIDFHEMVAGPISANARTPLKLEPTLRPKILYEDGEFFNFGLVKVNGSTLSVQIIDHVGKIRYQHAFRAN